MRESRIRTGRAIERWDTLEFLVEYSKIDMQFMIIGIRDEELDSKWLGETVNRQNFEEFMTDVLSRGIDPCGEYGEYHTLVTGLKEVKISLRPVNIEKSDSNMNYILIDVRRPTVLNLLSCSTRNSSSLKPSQLFE